MRAAVPLVVVAVLALGAFLTVFPGAPSADDGRRGVLFTLHNDAARPHDASILLWGADRELLASVAARVDGHSMVNQTLVLALQPVQHTIEFWADGHRPGVRTFMPAACPPMGVIHVTLHVPPHDASRPTPGVRTNCH